jgi:hypothetical protein
MKIKILYKVGVILLLGYVVMLKMIQKILM